MPTSMPARRVATLTLYGYHMPNEAPLDAVFGDTKNLLGDSFWLSERRGGEWLSSVLFVEHRLRGDDPCSIGNTTETNLVDHRDESSLLLATPKVAGSH